jgi:hypothetical protein
MARICIFIYADNSNWSNLSQEYYMLQKYSGQALVAAMGG